MGTLTSLVALAAGGLLSDAEREVLEREQAIGRAVVGHDAKFMDEVWGDDFIYTGVRGEVKDKSQVLAEFKAGALRFSKMEFDDIRVRAYGDTAIATGRALTEGTSPQGKIDGQFRYTRVYVRRDGRWTLVAFQATPLESAGKP